VNENGVTSSRSSLKQLNARNKATERGRGAEGRKGEGGGAEGRKGEKGGAEGRKGEKGGAEGR
jgi:hypothetical protein